MKVFLSYGHDDNARIVHRIADDLRQAGHDVWVDTSIRRGEHWRRAITEQLLDSELTLSCVADHYTRSEVCQDELAIALQVKGGNVYCILLEKPQPDGFQVPLGLTERQWLDMSDWREKEALGKQAFELWYSSKHHDILGVLEDPEHQRFAGEVEWLAGTLRPAPFSARLGALLGQGFVGRSWLLEEIEVWRSQNREVTTFCITGEPGIGKSAIAAWLAHFGRASVAAVHFCQHDHPVFSSPAVVVRSIAFQLATRIPDYRRFLMDTLDRLRRQAKSDQQEEGAEARSLAAVIDSMSAAELFDQLILEAAYFTLGGGRDRYLVVIDALDEAGGDLPRFLAQRSDRLPSWLGFVVTCRPEEPSVRPHLALLAPRMVAADDPRNRGDLEAAVQLWLAEQYPDQPADDSMLESILHKCDGNFLYWTMLKRLLSQTGATPASSLPEVPQGLGSLFTSFVQRSCPDIVIYRQRLAPFVSLLAAANAPLHEDVIAQALRLDPQTLKIEVLRPLGDLLRRQAGRVEFFHKSLKEWFTDEAAAGDYWVSLREGSRILGRSSMSQLRRIPNGLERLVELSLSCDKRTFLWSMAPDAWESTGIGRRLTELIDLFVRHKYPTAVRIDPRGPGGATVQTRQALMRAGRRALVGAQFQSESGCVRPDLLVPQGDGSWCLVLISGTTRVRDHHLQRLGVQAFLLEKAGLRLSGSQVMLTNLDFVMPEDRECDDLLKAEDVTQAVEERRYIVADTLDYASGILESTEPTTLPGAQCHELPETCPYLESRCAPPAAYPITLLPRSQDLVVRMRERDISDLRDLPSAEVAALPVISRRIWEASCGNKPVLIPQARDALAALDWPRRFLDVESTSFLIPRWAGTRPFEQVPTAWSIHEAHADGRTTHSAFLAPGIEFPVRAVAESLLAAIKAPGVTLVYNRAFERMVLMRLADHLPDLAADLRQQADRLVDLLVLVRSSFYHPSMRGSFSLKAVSRALPPDPAVGEYDWLAPESNSDDAFGQLLELRCRRAPDTGQIERLEKGILRGCAQSTQTMMRVAQMLACHPALDGVD